MLGGIRKYIDMLPAYDPEFFRVDDPKEPLFDANDLYSIVPFNQKRSYDMYDVMARLLDGSEFMEFKHGYGPEMITGLAKIDGLLVGVVANAQGMLMNYPEYKMATYGSAMGVGGKLYRQGLIKMNEFVTLCARDRIPMLWIQDTTGIDVGNDAERAELLGLGQSLIYSIQLQRPAHDGDHPPQGHRRGALCPRRPAGQRHQRLLHRHRHHRDLRHAR